MGYRVARRGAYGGYRTVSVCSSLARGYAGTAGGCGSAPGACRSSIAATAVAACSSPDGPAANRRTSGGPCSGANGFCTLCGSTGIADDASNCSPGCRAGTRCPNSSVIRTLGSAADRITHFAHSACDPGGGVRLPTGDRRVAHAAAAAAGSIHCGVSDSHSPERGRIQRRRSGARDTRARRNGGAAPSWWRGSRDADRDVHLLL